MKPNGVLANLRDYDMKVNKLKLSSYYRVTPPKKKKKKKELELFCFIFVEVIKKFMGSVFWGSPSIISTFTPVSIDILSLKSQ